jgi:hypothetical protein
MNIHMGRLQGWQPFRQDNEKPGLRSQAHFFTDI